MRLPNKGCITDIPKGICNVESLNLANSDSNFGFLIGIFVVLVICKPIIFHWASTIRKNFMAELIIVGNEPFYWSLLQAISFWAYFYNIYRRLNNYCLSCIGVHCVPVINQIQRLIFFQIFDPMVLQTNQTLKSVFCNRLPSCLPLSDFVTCYLTTFFFFFWC